MNLRTYAVIIHDALMSVHPALPWLVLAFVAYVANLSVEKLGLTPRIEAAAPWGPRARKALRDLPGVILAASWPALTLGSTDVRDAVLGAVSALVLPIVREALARYRGGPPSGGTGGKSTLNDELPDLPPLDDRLGRATLAMFAVLCLVGCAVPLESARREGALLGVSSAPTPGRCESLDDARTTWGAIAKGAAVVAGASGISALPVEDDEARLALASVGVTGALVGAVAVYVAEAKGEAWARECSRR